MDKTFCVIWDGKRATLNAFSVFKLLILSWNTLIVHAWIVSFTRLFSHALQERIESTNLGVLTPMKLFLWPFVIFCIDLYLCIIWRRNTISLWIEHRSWHSILLFQTYCFDSQKWFYVLNRDFRFKLIENWAIDFKGRAVDVFTCWKIHLWERFLLINLYGINDQTTCPNCKIYRISECT